jgi:diguanylate cyclase (GGDEF)-like protein/PAS domain S-box-containing protein
MTINTLPESNDKQDMQAIEILIVDDNANNLKLLRTLLSDEGYKVRLATSGQMAINSCSSSMPDLILLDISMPDMDGFKVCETINKSDATLNTPIIFLSALKDEFDIVHGFAVGGVDFITKPFKAEVLKARVTTHLTISRLQKNLKNINENLEKIVDERTEEIKNTNKSLEEEIEERIESQRQLSVSEELHRLTLANLGDTVIIITDKKGKFTYVSPGFKTLFGYEIDDLAETNFSKLFNISFINETIPQTNVDLKVFETNIINKQGETRSLIVSVKNAVINEKVSIYTCRDITPLKETQRNLLDSEERLKYALLASNEGIYDWDIENKSVFRNNTYFTMLGYDIDVPIENDRFYQELVHSDDKKIFQEGINKLMSGDIHELKSEFRVKMNDGNYCWVLSKSMVVGKNSNGTPTRIIGTQTDITREKQHEKHLKQLASFDPLTSLPNRKYFTDLLTSAILRGERKNQSHAILFLDLDRFKNINDSLGHTAGDFLLKIVANRLNDILRGNDAVARLGGDEFTILLEDISNSHRAAEVSQRIIEVLSEPFDLQGHQVVISPSIGIVLFPDHGTTHEELLKKADTAMYHAKGLGGNNYWYFTEAMNVAAHNRLELEEALRNALIRDEFILHYQPKININTGKIVGMESLVRWKRDGNHLVGPNIFIPAAEDTGLIVPIGKQIIHQAVQQTAAWVDDHLLQDKIAINISAKQFRQVDLLDYIKSTLEEFNLSPEYLEIEITEAAVMENTDEAISTMKRIKDFGITLAMDDFGTGYSSLSYLKKFPIDALKIDMSFIKDMESSEVNKSIVKTIIDLAHTLKLEVVAEGVEQQHQADLLSEMNCDLIQGYLCSKPVESNAMTRLLENNASLIDQTNKENIADTHKA